MTAAPKNIVFLHGLKGSHMVDVQGKHAYLTYVRRALVTVVLVWLLFLGVSVSAFPARWKIPPSPTTTGPITSCNAHLRLQKWRAGGIQRLHRRSHPSDGVDRTH